jgi:hypothetical protein
VPARDSEVRSQVASIGAHSLHANAKYDSRKLTANARAAWFMKFVDEVDPDRKLPEAERLRRAEHALRAHMLRLSLRSSQARKRAAK